MMHHGWDGFKILKVCPGEKRMSPTFSRHNLGLDSTLDYFAVDCLELF